MPKRTNDFQRLILTIEQALAGDRAQVTESEMVVNRSTRRPREVDILVRQEFGGREFRTAVECRDHRRKQDTSWIEQLKGKYEHMGMHRVIAVSRSGFSLAAREYAHLVGIDIMTLDQAERSNWLGTFDDLTAISLCRYRPLRLRVELLFPGEHGLPSLAHDNDPTSCTVLDGAGNPVYDLAECGRRIVRGKDVLDALDAQHETGVPVRVTVVAPCANGEQVRDAMGTTVRPSAIRVLAEMVRLVATAPLEHVSYDGARVAIANLKSDGDRYGVVLVQRQECVAKVGVVHLPPSQLKRDASG